MYLVLPTKGSTTLCSLLALTAVVMISQNVRIIVTVIQMSIILTYEVVGRLSDMPMKLKCLERF